jgi:CheY-like chemotaxis protein
MDKQKVLVVCRDGAIIAELAEILKDAGSALIVVDTVVQAVSHVQKHKYGHIVLGDKLVGNGDTYDVGQAIRMSMKNRRTPIVCVGSQPSRLQKLVNSLKPYARAAGQLIFADEVIDRLPAVFESLDAGEIDIPKAQIFPDAVTIASSSPSMKRSWADLRCAAPRRP